MTRRTKLAATAALIPLMLGASHAGDQTIIAVPNSRTEDLTPILKVAGQAFKALGPGDGLTVIDSTDGTIIVDFTIADDRRYTVESIKARDYADQDKAIRDHLTPAANSDPVDAATFKADIISTLSSMANVHRGRTDEAFALVYINPVRLDPHDPAMSMRDDKGTLVLPSGGLIAGSPAISVFGTAGRNTRLKGIYVTLCAPVPDELSQPERDALIKLWGQYIGAQGGILTGFSTDLKTCAAQFTRRLKDPLPVEPLAADDRPAMVRYDLSQRFDVVDIDRTRAAHDQINAERLAFERQLADATARIEGLEAKVKSERMRADKAQSKLAICEPDLKAAQSKLAEAEATLAILKVNPFEGERSISIFQDIRFPGRPFLSVKTGVAYDPEKFPQYDHSWCYYQVNDESHVSVTIDLGEKRRGGAIRWTTANDVALTRVGHSRGDFENAKSACRFPED